MLQVYALTITYLLLGASLLLVDEYGGRYVILIRIRNWVHSKSIIPLICAIIGVLLGTVKIFFPIPPGPILLGDLTSVFGVIVIAVYFITQLFMLKKQNPSSFSPTDAFRTNTIHVVHQDEDVIKKTGSLIEIHKRNLGYSILIVALLHFIFPGAVLL